MNILYLINHAGKGGSEKYVLSMAEYAISKDDRVFLLYNEHGPLVAQAETLGITADQISMANPLDTKAAKILSEYCKANKIDLIHTQFARENYIAILSKKLYGNNAEIIHTCHINTENNIIWRFINKMLSSYNYKIIAVCNSVRAKLIKNNYPAGKVQVIFNGVAFRESIEKTTYTAKSFGISENRFVFITLTRFSEEKGIFFLLESAKLLRETGSEFALVIAGDGPLYEEARQYIGANNLSDLVYLPGYRQDGAELLLGSDCFINSSSSEALSFAILEAMEAGLPIIATKVGGNPDIINENTNCGSLVEYNDARALSLAMADMLGNSPKRTLMAENSRKAIANIFNVENSIKATYKIYSEISAKFKGGSA